ncbi:hydrolase [Candidatus Nitrosotenuis aquarius]|uniref:hydrolase n=1 Tax=Candidatus Nitrosotenuis aquarius TaxID=1846278 RepID=UPI000C1F076A|nr:hydrolase [Candidatus Nitrosotenuis aquarius]
MSSQEKDELIRAQNELIGILFEIIKRFQANHTLDDEYFQIISGNPGESGKKRLDEILSEREENSRTISKLLEKIES